MTKKITLEQALEVWGQWKTARKETTNHFSIGELNEFLFHPLETAHREEILQHLRECPSCLAEFSSLDRLREEEDAPGGWDIALPKAAATAPSGPRRIATESGRYTIDIRPQLADSSRGLVIVRVSGSDPESVEGCLLTLRDSGRRVLLQGKISHGEVAQDVEDLDEIDYRFVVHVQPVQP